MMKYFGLFLVVLMLDGVSVHAQKGPGPAMSNIQAGQRPGPVTTDSEILAELNTDLPEMEAVKAAVGTGDLASIRQAYLAYRRTASSAR